MKLIVTLGRGGRACVGEEGSGQEEAIRDSGTVGGSSSPRLLAEIRYIATTNS